MQKSKLEVTKVVPLVKMLIYRTSPILLRATSAKTKYLDKFVSKREHLRPLSVSDLLSTILLIVSSSSTRSVSEKV